MFSVSVEIAPTSSDDGSAVGVVKRVEYTVAADRTARSANASASSAAPRSTVRRQLADFHALHGKLSKRFGSLAGTLPQPPKQSWRRSVATMQSKQTVRALQQYLGLLTSRPSIAMDAEMQRFLGFAVAAPVVDLPRVRPEFAETFIGGGGGLDARAAAAKEDDAAAAADGERTTTTPFVLLERLLQTILNNGAFITEDVFIPSAVWAQDGVRLASVGVKLAIYSELARYLHPLVAVAASAAVAAAAAAAAAVAAAAAAGEESAAGAQKVQRDHPPSATPPELFDILEALPHMRDTLHKSFGQVPPSPVAAEPVAVASFWTRVQSGAAAVRKEALKGAARVAAIPAVTPASQLKDYALALATLATHARALRRLIATSKLSASQLSEINAFFDECVNDLVILDVAELLEAYLVRGSTKLVSIN